ncbi:uroporphyrinogen decarboxylase family protein [Thermodesulfobacteriota bacterium]
MTGVERVIKALKREEPDRVPHLELGIDKKVREALLPGGSYKDFMEFMDLDGNCIFDKSSSWSYEPVDQPKRIFRDQWGALTQFGDEAIGHPIEARIKNEKDLDTYVPPDPDEEWRYETLKRWIKRFKGERAILAHVTDVFNIAKESLLGEVPYFEAMIENPDLVDRVNEIVLNYNLRSIKNQIELGADALAISGDFAMTKSPMVSPKFTARFLTPALKKQVELGHSLNMLVLKHTDGDLRKIMDLMVDTGIDGLHPIDPMAGMDLGEMKKEYGDRLCLMGNINCGATLSWKSEEEVRQEVKEAIKKAGYGGGYICMSSNSIHSGVRPENYVAMVEAIREYGTYPLELD